jgi:hypothetical protein
MLRSLLLLLDLRWHLLGAEFAHLSTKVVKIGVRLMDSMNIGYPDRSFVERLVAGGFEPLFQLHPRIATEVTSDRLSHRDESAATGPSSNAR